MAWIKLTNRQNVKLVRALNALMGQDLDPVFSFRCSMVLEEAERRERAYTKTKEKQDEKYVDRDADGNRIPAENGQGFKIQDGLQEEYRERINTLQRAGVHLEVPRIRLSDVVREWEQEKEVPGWIIHALRPVLKMDVEALEKAREEEPGEELDFTDEVLEEDELSEELRQELGLEEEAPAEPSRPTPGSREDMDRAMPAEKEEGAEEAPRRRSRASVPTQEE